MISSHVIPMLCEPFRQALFKKIKIKNQSRNGKSSCASYLYSYQFKTHFIPNNAFVLRYVPSMLPRRLAVRVWSDFLEISAF